MFDPMSAFGGKADLAIYEHRTRYARIEAAEERRRELLFCGMQVTSEVS